MRRRTYAAIASMILIVMFTGCGSPSNSTPVPATLSSIAVTPSSPSIAPSTTTKLTAWGIYSNGGRRNLTTQATWSSSNTGIALVSAGLVTAGSSTGSTVITALYSGITGSTLLTTSSTVSLVLSPATSQSLAPGMTRQFTAIGTLATSATQTLTSWATWASSNEPIVTVSDLAGSKGLATAGATPGTTTISAMFGGTTSSATFTTSLVSTITTSPTMASINMGTSKQFSAAGVLVDTTPVDLTSWATWSSSNIAVATINAGLASSHATGTTFISAELNGIISSPVSTLIVTPVVLISIATSPTNTSLALGVDQQYIATGTFSDLSTKNVTTSTTWHSSNPAVATISTTGFATSLSEGTTDIIASTPSVTSNTAKLIITQAVLVSIAVTPTSANVVFPAATKKFTAMGTYTDGSVLDLTDTATWVSSDTNISTTVSKGLVTVTSGWGAGGNSSITAEVSGITSNIATLTATFF